MMQQQEPRQQEPQQRPAPSPQLYTIPCHHAILLPTHRRPHGNLSSNHVRVAGNLTLMALRVLKQSVDGTTGYLTVLVRIEETHMLPDGSTQISHGPEETVVISPESLMRKFHVEHPAKAGQGVATDSPTARAASSQHAQAPAAATPASLQAAVERWLAAHHTAALARKQHLDCVRQLAQGLVGKLIAEAESPAPAPVPTPAPVIEQPAASQQPTAAAPAAPAPELT